MASDGPCEGLRWPSGGEAYPKLVLFVCYFKINILNMRVNITQNQYSNIGMSAWRQEKSCQILVLNLRLYSF